MIFNENLIAFFKKHNLYDKAMFDYLSSHTEMIDYKDEKQRCFIGCFYKFNKNILTDIRLNIPYVYDEITMLISIHEIIHAIILYKKLNKKAKISDDCEVLPILYEKIYVEENSSETLKKYQQKLDNLIDKNDQKYFIALAVREELYQNYNYDINKMKKISKRLVKKYKNKQQEV